MKKAGLWLLIAICLGCPSSTPNSITLSVTPQSLWDTPVPTPAFLRGLEALTNETGTSLGTCIVLNGPEIGFTSDDDSETSQISAPTVQIYMDGRRINQWVFASLTWFSPTICFYHNDLSHGLHVADIEFTSSGKSYWYMWAFRIFVDDDGKPMVTYPDSLQS
jgi:hypothetical protein